MRIFLTAECLWSRSANSAVNSNADEKYYTVKVDSYSRKLCVLGFSASTILVFKKDRIS